MMITWRFEVSCAGRKETLGLWIEQNEGDDVVHFHRLRESFYHLLENCLFSRIFNSTFDGW